MPYIKLTDRTKYTGHVKDVLAILADANDTPYLKGELFGYFANRFLRRFLVDPDYTQNSFNSAFFNESKKKTLTHCADSMAAMVNRADPVASASELNYVLSAILWGFLGQADGFAQAGYGMRAYLTGILDKIADSIETINHGNQRDAAMAFRRHLVIRGVVWDVLAETYRRFTPEHEHSQMLVHGDIWEGGALIATGSELVKT